jgi:hypothetical protein
MKQSRISAFALISILSLSLVPSAIAQYHTPRTPQLPSVPMPPGYEERNQHNNTLIIPISPYPTFSESIVFGPNNQITIIQQQGYDTFVTTSP